MTTADDSKRDNARGQAVLLVEDDALLAMELEEALMRAGAGSVSTFSSMAAAFNSLEQTRADAIILDVHLSDRDDGWALAELASMLGARPPRIAFSTATPEAIPPAIRELGAVFEKPYDPAHLADVILNNHKTGLIDRLRGAFS